MAKIKKRKLCWKASVSSQVVGYKLYWSENKVLDYDSKNEMLGNVTEIILPDGVDSFKPESGPLTFGVTAVDELGNESDIILLAAPYQFNVPEAPGDLHLQAVNDYYTSNDQQDKSNKDNETNHDEPSEPLNFDNGVLSEKSNDGMEFSKKVNLIIKQSQEM
jgi:hypothetical protein